MSGKCNGYDRINCTQVKGSHDAADSKDQTLEDPLTLFQTHSGCMISDKGCGSRKHEPSERRILSLTSGMSNTYPPTIDARTESMGL